MQKIELDMKVVRLGGTQDAGAKIVQSSEKARRRQQRQDLQTTVVHGDLGRKLIIKSMSYLCELAIKKLHFFANF